MAVFMINICKYNGCGITFPSLGDLIQHIEDTHIDYDPSVAEQKESPQPSCIPLSYVLRFFTEASRRQLASLPVPVPVPPPPPVPEVRRRVFTAPKTPSLRSSTPTGSEMDEEEMMSPSEDSNDSWTTVEEYSSEYILRYGVKHSQAVGPHIPHPTLGHDKPFACPVPGCKKRYKNVNGIKYHSKNGHKKDGKIKKAHKCQCGKSYKTAQGLRHHTASHHAAAVARSHTPPTLHLIPKNAPGLVVTASNSMHNRPLAALDAVDGNKLVRIYDSLKPKDLPSLTITKQNLKSVDYATQFRRNSAILTPNSSPESSPGEKGRYDRSPVVSVQSQPPITPPGHANHLFMPKLTN